MVDRLTYRFSTPKRGDLMVFGTSKIPRIRTREGNSASEIYFVKRVVGLPGEKIQIKDGIIYANGVALDAAQGIPPIHYVSRPDPNAAFIDLGETYTVGPDEYFVLGDNSDNSYDSRFWGNVPASSIHGKVSKIYYPFDRMGRPHYEDQNPSP